MKQVEKKKNKEANGFPNVPSINGSEAEKRENKRERTDKAHISPSFPWAMMGLEKNHPTTHASVFFLQGADSPGNIPHNV